jgi:nucleoside-diphosphate-sugar epimerase
LTDISQKASSFEAFVNLSSVAVYGECKIEVDEESSTTPINEYGQFKLEFEQLLKDIKIANLLNLRVSNVFGDSSFDDVLNRVHRSILRGEPLKLMDPSRITRDFIGVDQVVSYTLDLLGKGLFKYSSQFIDINIASGISLYLSEAVEVIEKIIGQNLLIDVVGLEAKVIFESRISNKKLRSLVSVQDFLPSDEIERYFRWLSNQ